MNDKSKVSYFQIIIYFMAIKKEYTSHLSPFFNAQKVKECKQYIYSQKISISKKDKLWCYLNDDITLADLLNFLN